MMKNRTMRKNTGSKNNPMKTRIARGQSLLEYVTIIVAVVAAMSAMTLYVRRGVLNANLNLIGAEISPKPLPGKGG